MPYRLATQFLLAIVLFASLTSCITDPRRPSLDHRFPEPTVSYDKAKMLTASDVEDASLATIISDVPTTPTALHPGAAIPLTLGDVLQTTLANNLSVRLEEINRQNARDEIDAEQGIYDLLIRSEAGYNRAAFASRNRAGGVRTRTEGRSENMFAAAGASQLLPTGGVVSLDYLNEDNESKSRGSAGSSKSESDPQSLTLGVAQPLLRDAGPDVTNAGIRIARNNSKISYESFRAEVMRQLGLALRFYWDLVFAVNNLDVQKVSLAQAQELLRTNQVKYETGWSPITDVLQAQAQVAARAEQIIVAQKEIQDIMDALKRRMNLPEEIQQWQLQLIPLQKPTFFEVDYNELESLQLAIQKRPEALQADLALANNLIDETVAKNQKLPVLDARGDVGYIDPGSGADSDVDNYSAGLFFEYPLQNRAARARHRQAVANVEGGELNIEETQQAIFQQVRLTLRAIKAARERIDVTRAAIDYETQKLQSERERFDVGISTSFQVLEFQEDFAIAQVNYLQAVVDYNKALIDFEEARGTLLDTLGVEIEGYGVSKPTKVDYYEAVNVAAEKKAALGR